MITKLEERCTDLQSQITAINEKKQNEDANISMKAKEQLLSRSDFSFNDDSTSDSYDSMGGGTAIDGNVPNFPKFECKSAGYMSNLDSQRFKEPRMFTMKQIRNIAFACLNQSTLNERMKLSEMRHEQQFMKSNELQRVD